MTTFSRIQLFSVCALLVLISACSGMGIGLGVGTGFGSGLSMGVGTSIPLKSTRDKSLGQAFIAPKLSMNFPALADFGGSLEANQIMTTTYKDKVSIFENQISITPQQLVLVLNDSSGKTVLTITWNKDGMNYQKSPDMPEYLPPENVLADFILMNWPVASIRKALQPSGAILVETPEGRVVKLEDKTLITMQTISTPSSLKAGQYQNFAWNYKLDIKAVPQTAGNAKANKVQKKKL